MPAMSGRQRALVYLGYGLLIALVVTGALLVVPRRPAGLPGQSEAPPTALPGRVDVTGAVVSPGVYQLPPNSIVQDALAAAGGATAQADLSLLNLAHRLQDGDQVVVPSRVPTAPASSPTPAGAAPAATPATTRPSNTNRLNINTASVDELVALPRIGPALAQRIVDYPPA